VLVEVPPDIEGLRRTDPERAAAWRPTLRNRLLPMLERGDMIMVVNFRDRPTEVDVGRTVEPVITIGQIEVADHMVRLGPHSAVAADATQYLVFAAPRRAAAVLRGNELK